MDYKKYVFLLGVSVMLANCKGIFPEKKETLVQKYKEVTAVPVDCQERLCDIFPKTVTQIEVWCEAAKNLAQEELAAILALKPEERTFDNTVRALDISQNKLSGASSHFHLVSMVNPDAALREAGHQASTDLGKFSVDLYFVPELYQAFVDYMDFQGKTETLTEEGAYYLQESIKDFKRMGLDLHADLLMQVKTLKKEMSQLGNDFQRNIATDMPTVKIHRDELTGMNPDMVKALKSEGDFCVLGVDYPTYFEVMENCSVASTRKSLYLAFQNRAYPQNDELLKNLFAKRHEVAQLLGYTNFASYDIDGTMAKTEDRVEQFLVDLASTSAQKARKEVALLSEDLPDGVLLEDGVLNPWDYLFVKESYKKKHFSIDESKIAEYFPVQKAIDGMFAIYQQFLGLTFKEVTPTWSWHEEVRLIEIFRSENNEFLGYLFLDLYPRENKYTHACYVPLVPTHQVHGVQLPSVGVVVANFPRATDDKPALLKHSDVETFFHEFGHAMHGVLGRTELAACSGTSVKTDYVEMPSQMFEEWMLDAEMLKSVSAHYQTGEPLPEDIIQKKIELKKFDSGYFVVRQCMLSFLSLTLGQLDRYDLDPAAMWKTQYEKYMQGMMRYEPQAHAHASFGHLASSGYASKYYSYMWSKVFALDIFAEVKRFGLVNKEIGQRIAQGLLGKGGSVDPDQLLVKFLGRSPNQNAFLEDLGLL